MIQVDLNHEYVQTWKLNRDMRYVCPVLYVVFQSSSFYDFSDKESCVVFRDTNWTPFSYNENAVSGGYIYSMSCYPSIAFKEIGKFYHSTSELAADLGLQLYGSSAPVKFDVPTTGLTLEKLLNKHRVNSMLQHWDSLDQASYFYFEADGLLSSTYGDLLRTNSRSLGLDSDTILSSGYGYNNAIPYHERMLESTPEFQTYAKKIDTLFGRKFTLECPQLYMPGVIYTGVTSSGWHEDIKKLICLQCVGSKEWAPNVWHTVFAEVILNNSK